MTIQERFENYIRISKRIAEYENGDNTAYIGAVSYGTAVMSSKISDRVADTVVTNAAAEAKYIEDKKEIEFLNRYIDAMTDAETKDICILKYCKGLSWERIAERLNYERTSVSKKIKRYFEKFPTIPV